MGGKNTINMKFTIDTDAKTITIHGSFKYEDFQYIMTRVLPPDWRESYKIIGPIEEMRYIPDPIWVQPFRKSHLDPPWTITCTNLPKL